MKSIIPLLRRCTSASTGPKVNRVFFSSRTRQSGQLVSSITGNREIPAYMKYIWGACFLVVGGVVISSYEMDPVTKRRRFMFVSREKERSFGNMVYQRILQDRRRDILPAQHPANRMVQRVGKRIASASGRSDFDWEFTLIESDDINAFALPGGKVCVFTGLFKALKDEDMLAAVMAHEVGHVLARHSAETMSVDVLVQLVLFIVAATFGIMDTRDLDLVKRLFLDLPFSRKHELEADSIGLTLAARACYRPSKAINLFQNLSKLEKGGWAPAFTSTHPAHETRIAALREQLRAAEDIYTMGGCDRKRRAVVDLL